MTTTTTTTVEISNRNDYSNEPTTYTAHCRADCKDSVDRNAYDLAVQFGDVITIGHTIAAPIACAPVYTPRKQTGACHRCNGKGTIAAFKHVHGGACFRCSGTGRT